MSYEGIESLNSSFVTNLPGTENVQLCFNKAHFNRSDFNVERFISLARRRATLDQIQIDLKNYLRLLQNSMVELINDDYTDFVNLSSNLATLKESIDKISLDYEVSLKNFMDSTSEIRKSANFIDKNCEELTSVRRRQLLARNKIALVLSTQRLSNLMMDRPTEVSFKWLIRLIQAIVDLELWKNRVPETSIPERLHKVISKTINNVKKFLTAQLINDMRADCKYVPLIHSTLTLIHQVDFAISQVANELIDSKIEKKDMPLDQLLKCIFEQIHKLRADWLAKLSSNGMLSSEVELFMDQCLLQYILALLDQRFGSILVPSDNRLFHSCYTITCDFISNWPTLTKSQPMLKAIKDRFNTLVYFKLETSRFFNEFKEASDPASFKFTFPDDPELQGAECYCLCSQIFIRAIDQVFSDEVYLPALMDKFWDFTLKMASNYIEYVTRMINSLKSKSPDVPDKLQPWLILTILGADILLCDTKLLDICINKVWIRLRELDIDTSMFGKCISLFSAEVSTKKKEIDEILTSLFLELISKELVQVGEIPKLYRWTKKPMPTEHSGYLLTAFEVTGSFMKEAIKFGWDDEIVALLNRNVIDQAVKVFREKAEQVVLSVEQTGSSLQRFKRKGVGASDAPVADSDEAKIKKQLNFDVLFVRQKALEANVDSEPLDQLLQRTQSEAN